MCRRGQLVQADGNVYPRAWRTSPVQPERGDIVYGEADHLLVVDEVGFYCPCPPPPGKRRRGMLKAISTPLHSVPEGGLRKATSESAPSAPRRKGAVGDARPSLK